MGGMTRREGYMFLVLVSLAEGVRAESPTGIIVTGAVLGALVITLVLIISLIYYLRSSKNSEKKPPHRISNGGINHGPPLHVSNGVPYYQKRIPPQAMNGTTGGRATPKGPPNPPLFMSGPHMQMMGTFRGPPTVFVGSFTRHGRPPPPRMPSMMHPYFFRPPYGQVIYVDDDSYSEDESDDSSGRSTVRERKKRYHRSFLGKKRGGESSIIIKEVDETTAAAFSNRQEERSRSPPRARSKSPVHEKSKSRSRSRTPTPISRQDLRTSKRYSSENEETNQEEPVNYTPSPAAGDVSFFPVEPQRDPSPTPGPSYKSDYTYATAIKPQVNPSSTTARSGLGDPDQDLRQSRTAPSNPLRMSMSERMSGIVEDGWGGRPSEFDTREKFEYPPRNTDLGKSQKIEEEAEDHIYAVSLRQSRKENRPPTPPNDIPPTPRDSMIRPMEPTADYSASDVRPVTPPFDAYDLSPKPSFREQPSTESTSKIGQSEGGNRSAFTNQVLQELKLRQRPNALDENDHSVNFSREPDEIIPRSEPPSTRTSVNVPDQMAPPPPPPLPPGGIPAPPPPPPLPK